MWYIQKYSGNHTDQPEKSKHSSVQHIGYKMPKPSLPPTQSSQSVRERTYRLLRKQLLTGQFGPRQRLTEESLARRLGVSRTPSRGPAQAGTRGTVSSAGATGFRVPDDSLDDMNELFAIREILEGHALAELSRIVTPNDIGDLRQIVEQAEAGLPRTVTGEGLCLQYPLP